MSAELTLIVARLEAAVTRLEQVAAARPQQVAASTGGPTFPNYGKSKGMPVSGATAGDLAFYRGGCLRTLGDDSKARFHEKERGLLAAIDAEMRRQGVDPAPVSSFDPPPPSDADAPPDADLTGAPF